MPNATTTTTTSQRSSKSEIRTAEIYRVAANLIQEKGYDATSMNDIAKKL
jgi:AcrR family transcriptional regulator